jgi:hypothetical protein
MRGILLRSIGALAACFLLVSGAHSATINISAEISITGATATNFCCNLEMIQRSSSFSPNPVTVQDGDTIILTFSFSDNKALLFSDVGEADGNGFLFDYLPNTSTGTFINTSSSLVLTGTSGDVLTTTFNNPSTNAFDRIIIRADGDLTDTSAKVWSGVITSQINSGLPDPHEISSLIMRAYGDQVSVSTVPIPAAVYLFGSVLGLLGWTRRKT